MPGLHIFAVLGLPLAGALGVTFVIPLEAPASAAILNAAPVSISYEFFAFPSYFTNVSNTQPCVQNLQDLTQVQPRIRIGGTTQDRAVFDPLLKAYVNYAVPNYTVAPSNLTYGPSLLTLAGTYPGEVVVGLNRGHDNLTNTIAAAKVAVGTIKTLYALELGNEPDLYLGNGQEIATNQKAWTPQLDASSEATWQIAVGKAVNKTSIIQAGNFVSSPPTWSAAELVANEKAAAIPYIKDWSHHNYHQGGSSANVKLLMNHTDIASNLAIYAADLKVANATGKEYVIGETNSVSGGGAAAVSPTFAGALWVLDFSLRATSMGIKRIYYHFGTVGNCAYCWWSPSAVASPYYGGYAATAALANGSYISALDDGSGLCAAYTIYSASRKPLRAVLYNSVFWNGTGTRASQVFTLTGLSSSSLPATGNATRLLAVRRLTAASALARQDQGSAPTFAGRTFDDVGCGLLGQEVVESVAVVGGVANVSLAASEAVIVDF